MRSVSKIRHLVWRTSDVADYLSTNVPPPIYNHGIFENGVTQRKNDFFVFLSLFFMFSFKLLFSSHLYFLKLFL